MHFRFGVNKIEYEPTTIDCIKTSFFMVKMTVHIIIRVHPLTFVGLSFVRSAMNVKDYRSVIIASITRVRYIMGSFISAHVLCNSVRDSLDSTICTYNKPFL